MTASSAPSRAQRLRLSSTSRSSGPRLVCAYCSSASSCSTGMFAVSRISIGYPLYMSQVIYLSQMTLVDVGVIGQGNMRPGVSCPTRERGANPPRRSPPPLTQKPDETQLDDIGQDQITSWLAGHHPAALTCAHVGYADTR